MSDQKLIIATYERLEDEAGGMWNAIPSMTLDKVAQELDIPRDEVSTVMVSYWKVAQELDIPRDEVSTVMVSYWTNQGAG